mmetsp:Transcript_10896/g.15630  ORF Transcript_10896/g.15630 Transcript_10896/m.15630 type:complete len:106 (-) Transcript_10896:1260-1577(-)
MAHLYSKEGTGTTTRMLQRENVRVAVCCSVAVHCSAWQGVANRHRNMRANAQFDPSQAFLALRARDSLGVLKKTAFDIGALRVTAGAAARLSKMWVHMWVLLSEM